VRHDAFEIFCTHALGSLSPRERAGGEGLFVPAKGAGDPHPNPLPEGRGAVKLAPLRRRRRGERAKTPSADTVAEEGKKGRHHNHLDEVLAP
jgi:hypothetical protein